MVCVASQRALAAAVARWERTAAELTESNAELDALTSQYAVSLAPAPAPAELSLLRGVEVGVARRSSGNRRVERARAAAR